MQKIEKKYLDFTPSLTIEILSPSTAYKDRHEKFELYEQEAVPYYLVVDPQFKKIEIHELKENTSPPPFRLLPLYLPCRTAAAFLLTWRRSGTKSQERLAISC